MDDDIYLDGDAVRYVYAGSVGVEEIHGFVAGKLTTEASSTYSVASPPPPHYVIAAIEPDWRKLDDEIMYKMTFHPFVMGSGLEWGSFPEKGWFVASSSSLERTTTSPQVKELLKKKGLCPRCGKLGSWISLALVCDKHGIYV